MWSALRKLWHEFWGLRHLQLWTLKSTVWSRKMPQGKIGQKYTFAVAASDASAIPPGTLVVSSDNPSVSVNKTGDLTGEILLVSPGSANVTYSAPGFKPATEAVTVTDIPDLVVTDGPVQ